MLAVLGMFARLRLRLTQAEEAKGQDRHDDEVQPCGRVSMVQARSCNEASHFRFAFFSSSFVQSGSKATSSSPLAAYSSDGAKFLSTVSAIFQYWTRKAISNDDKLRVKNAGMLLF